MEQWRKAENLIKRPQYEGQTPEDKQTDEKARNIKRIEAIHNAFQKL